MKKRLEEMSNEELWQLFPIELKKPQFEWKSWYEEESALLRRFLPSDHIKRISHVGSTSVKTIWAKPIVDILAEMTPEGSRDVLKELLLQHGYRCMSQDEKRMSFNKGYTEEGFAQKVFHLHLRYPGDNDELYFRDFLIDHPETAEEYERLKLSLGKSFQYDRDAYTEAKTGFIVRCTRKARELYGSRY
ncbi:GrpB family protein [Anaerolentibacter hominis]|uniref:GrpB family protein n=1 Tax=Anaerolentibacter hominis TaxID=3079009 RepID=UPI0031B873CC